MIVDMRLILLVGLGVFVMAEIHHDFYRLSPTENRIWATTTHFWKGMKQLTAVEMDLLDLV